MNKITILLCFLGILLHCNSFASPALRTPFTITLSNGESISVVKRGNEFRHWIETVEGNQLVIEEPGNSYRIASEEEKQQFFAEPLKSRRVSQNIINGLSSGFPTKGKMRSLVILVNFKDVKMQSATANRDFWRMLNEEGYSELGGTGSARDYYIENSMGLFTPDFDVVGPIDLNHDYKYYGQNDITGEDAHAVDMVIEACRLADETIDFSKYDFNNDGYIDNVFVFYAGRGEATSSDANTVWPHSWDVSEYTKVPVVLDGKKLNHYACSNEIADDERMDGIGTFVHEFGHVLGLPDLYPTTSAMAFSPNTWSVMDEGEYNNKSRTPPYFTVFERYSLQWLTPVEILKEGCSVVIDNISTNEGYIIPTETETEFYLLENRQQKGWDSYLPGHGLLIWHIDYDEYLWTNNRVNSVSTHQYVDIVEADNIQSTGTRSGDTFPGAANITSFTASTNPAFIDWKGNDVGAPLTNIKEENGLIVLDVSGGGAPLEPIRYAIPKILDSSDISAHSFVVNWEPVDEAEGYYLSVGQLLEGNRKEAVADFNGGIGNISAEWQTNVTASFSNSSYAGVAIPSMRMQKDGDYIAFSKGRVHTVKFWCRGSSIKSGTHISIDWIQGNEVVASDSYVPTTTGTVVEFETELNADAVRLTYVPAPSSGSVAIDDIYVSYGEMGFSPIRDDAYTTDTQLLVEGLDEDTDYVCYVVAAKGDMLSRQSDYAKVHTSASDGIDEIQAAKSTGNRMYNIAGLRISNTSQHGIFVKNGKKVIK